jgi:hypothetical protein
MSAAASVLPEELIVPVAGVTSCVLSVFIAEPTTAR